MSKLCQSSQCRSLCVSLRAAKSDQWSTSLTRLLVGLTRGRGAFAVGGALWCAVVLRYEEQLGGT